MYCTDFNFGWLGIVIIASCQSIQHQFFNLTSIINIVCCGRLFHSLCPWFCLVQIFHSPFGLRIRAGKQCRTVYTTQITVVSPACNICSADGMGRSLCPFKTHWIHHQHASMKGRYNADIWLRFLQSQSFRFFSIHKGRSLWANK